VIVQDFGMEILKLLNRKGQGSNIWKTIALYTLLAVSMLVIVVILIQIKDRILGIT
jgi:hypothetical protein|tara:strand:+ start:2860 stop:3027 length:168 start_codon:yes stop_codon:yes gene_type:complete